MDEVSVNRESAAFSHVLFTVVIPTPSITQSLAVPVALVDIDGFVYAAQFIKERMRFEIGMQKTGVTGRSDEDSGI